MKLAFWHFYTLRLLRGIETLVLSLSNALVDKGVDVSIVTATPTLQPLVRPDPRVRVYAFPTGRYFQHFTIVPFYAGHFMRHAYDHIFTFFADFGEGWTWRLVHWLREMPLVLYLCYPYSSVPHRYHSFLRLGWEREARHIVADAEWIAREAAELFHRRVEVVPVGTDPQRFRPDPAWRAEMRRQWGFTDHEVVLLNVSALERGKGTWRVLQSMGRLKERFPQLRYVILGSGADEARLKDMVTELGLDQRVFFAGTTSQLERYYNMADIFVMLPDAEANSIACHEAMSCGLPVLVSRTGGFPEDVPCNAGWLVDPHSPQEIDESLSRLITDSALRRRMGSAGRAHILAHYSWDRIAERLLDALQ